MAPRRRDRHPFVRSSPLFGAIGGLIGAVSVQTTGLAHPDAPLAGAIRALFEVSPVLGYVTFVAFGAILGWLFRCLERWGV